MWSGRVKRTRVVFLRQGGSPYFFSTFFPHGNLPNLQNREGGIIPNAKLRCRPLRKSFIFILLGSVSSVLYWNTFPQKGHEVLSPFSFWIEADNRRSQVNHYRCFCSYCICAKVRWVGGSCAGIPLVAAPGTTSLNTRRIASPQRWVTDLTEFLHGSLSTFVVQVVR